MTPLSFQNRRRVGMMRAPKRLAENQSALYQRFDVLSQGGSRQGRAFTVGLT